MNKLFKLCSAMSISFLLFGCSITHTQSYNSINPPVSDTKVYELNIANNSLDSFSVAPKLISEDMFKPDNSTNVYLVIQNPTQTLIQHIGSSLTPSSSTDFNSINQKLVNLHISTQYISDQYYILDFEQLNPKTSYRVFHDFSKYPVCKEQKVSSQYDNQKNLFNTTALIFCSNAKLLKLNK